MLGSRGILAAFLLVLWTLPVASSSHDRPLQETRSLDADRYRWEQWRADSGLLSLRLEAQPAIDVLLFTASSLRFYRSDVNLTYRTTEPTWYRTPAVWVALGATSV